MRTSEEEEVLERVAMQGSVRELYNKVFYAQSVRRLYAAPAHTGALSPLHTQLPSTTTNSTCAVIQLTIKYL